MKIRIIPIYGYGWSKGSSFAEPPPPFELEVRQFTRMANSQNFDLLVGKILPPHEYGNCWALLYARTMGVQPDYNIHMYADEVSVDEKLRTLPEIEPVAVGFATLDVNTRATKHT